MTNKTVWELSEEEKSQAEAKINNRPIHHRMLMILGLKVDDSFIRLMDYYNNYDKDQAFELEAMFEIFNKWGFTLTDEEQELMDGSSILYEDVAREVDVKGLMDDAHCPYCDNQLDDYIDQDKCPYCGQKLKWDHWHAMQDAD